MPNEEHQNALRRLAAKVEEGPVRFLVPGVVVAALAVSVVNGYTPLEFQAPEAKASAATENLDKKVDAAKLEKKKLSKPKKVKASSSVSAADLKDGTYTGYSRCTEEGVFDYWLCLDVTIEDGKVVNISNVRGSGTGRSGSANLGSYDKRNVKYLDWAVKGRGSQEGVVSQLLDVAVKGSSAGSIDTVSGATYSSQSILEAYQDALSQASVSGASASTATAVKAKVNKSATATSKSKKVKTKSSIGSGTKFADGTWRGYDRCSEEDQFDYYVAVDVTVKDGKVAKLSNIHGSGTGNAGSKDLGEYDTVNDTYLGWAIDGRNGQSGVSNQIAASIAKGEIASSIDTVSGATYSSRSILKAYLDALKKSAKAAGSRAKIPGSDNSGSEDSAESGADSSSSQNGSASEGEGDASSSTGGGSTDGTSAAQTPENPNSGFADGTYTAYGFAGDTAGGLDFSSYYIGVTIKVAGGKIAELSASDIAGDTEGKADPAYTYDAAENAYYFKRAVNGYGISGKHPGLVSQINSGLQAGSSLVSYDTVSGATYSSQAIIDAYTAAVALAKAQVQADSDESASTGGATASGDSAGSAGETAGSNGDEAVASGSEAGLGQANVSEGADGSLAAVLPATDSAGE